MSKDDLPVSDAETWSLMMQYQDGKDVLAVVNAMIMTMKQVPEAIVHPVSQVVRIMVPPVVRVVDDIPKFAMSANVHLNTRPSQWEVWMSGARF